MWRPPRTASQPQNPRRHPAGGSSFLGFVPRVLSRFTATRVRSPFSTKKDIPMNMTLVFWVTFLATQVSIVALLVASDKIRIWRRSERAMKTLKNP
jgi:hypothetical protein